jgi:hypothetical protein
MLAPDGEPFSREDLLAPFSREELLARYRRQRALPDDPFEQGGKPVPPPGYRERIMSHPRPASRFLEPDDAPAAPPPQRRSLSLGQTFAVAAAMALAAGAGVGMVNARLFSGAPVAPACRSRAGSGQHAGDGGSRRADGADKRWSPRRRFPRRRSKSPMRPGKPTASFRWRSALSRQNSAATFSSRSQGYRRVPISRPDAGTRTRSGP